jgi:ankyrin repeat protein
MTSITEPAKQSAVVEAKETGEAKVLTDKERKELADKERIDAAYAKYQIKYALHDACRENERERARDLLEAGADVGLVDSEGHSPLWDAVFSGHTAIVRLLLMKKADKHSRDSKARLLPTLSRVDLKATLTWLP